MFWFIVGLVVGLMLPAPYDAIARNAVSKVWNWLRGLTSN